jgi:hypothetical protein
MANTKISALTSASTPLTGTEVVPVVQSSTTKKVTTGDLLTGTVPSGTANGVMYLNGSKVATTGSGLTFDGTNLGIGGGSSGPRLQINTSTSNSVRLYNTTGGGTTLDFVDQLWQSQIEGYGGDLVFKTGGTAERMRFNSSGDLGIGTSSPGAKLDILGTGIQISRVRDTSATGYSGITVATSGAQAYAIGVGGASETAFSVANKFFVYDSLAGAMRLVIDSSGNLGLGVTSPTAKLDVDSDTVRVRTAKTPASATAAGNAGDICWDANYVYICVATNTWKRSALTTW